MKGFFRRASISAVTVLLICWPAGVVCEDNDVIKWIKNRTIPNYTVIALGGLLLVTIIGCICCLWCARRRRRKDSFTADAKEGPCNDSSWEMIPSSTKETQKGDSKEADKDRVTIIKISVENTGSKKEEKKSSEATTDLVGEESRDQEEQKQQTQEDPGPTYDEIKDEENESGMPSPNIMKASDNVTDTTHDNSIDGTNDKEKDGLKSAEGLYQNNSDKPRVEPLYAEVSKTKQKGKKKAKSGYNIVYAELADFDKNQSDKSLPKNNFSSVAEYAEIARLTKSPRDMCPLDD